MSIDNIGPQEWDWAAQEWLAKVNVDRINIQNSKPRVKADDYQISGNHYKEMPIEPWKLAEVLLTKEEYIGALKFGVLKYTMRDGKKVGSDDAGKALHYWKKLQEVLGGSA